MNPDETHVSDSSDGGGVVPTLVGRALRHEPLTVYGDDEAPTQVPAQPCQAVG